MPLCVYCREKEADGHEHWMPRALGKFRGFECLEQKICQGCNNLFGRQLEDDFAHASPEAFFREALGIKGRPGHRRVNPVYHRTASTHPFRLLCKDPDRGDEILWEIVPGHQYAVQRARQILIRDKNGLTHPIPIPEDGTPGKLREILEKRGLLEGQVTYFYVGKQDEIPWMTELIRTVFPDCQVEDPDLHSQGQTVEIEANVSLSENYTRALAKVAFHYLLKFCPQYDGNEDAFNAIKQFIYKGGDWRRFIEFPAQEIIDQAGQLMDYSHFTAIDIRRYEITTRLQFFAGRGNLPVVWGIRLGRNPSKIIYEQGIGHRFRYFNKNERSTRNDGEMIEIQAIRLVIPATQIPPKATTNL